MPEQVVYQHRSPGVWRDPSKHEIYTAQDYVRARSFESVLDIIGHQKGFPTDEATVYDAGELAEATEHLGITVNTNFDSEIELLLNDAQDFCTTLANGHCSGMCIDELVSYTPTYQRDEQMYLKPFFQQIKYFISRFVAEQASIVSARDSSVSQTAAYIDSMRTNRSLFERLRRLAKPLFDHDIPLYDMLFDEFDTLAARDDNHLEIYVGRDGVHAYAARLGEIAAREVVSNETGDLSPVQDAVNLLYMVHNSHTIKADTSTKEEYVRSHFDADASVQIFDSGYQGSVPADILRQLGYDGAMLDARIHLLNSMGNPMRRLKSLDGDQYIGDIENAPKPEAAADTLVRNAQGELQYRRDTVGIDEQFLFVVLRSMTIRHFWVKEYLRLKGVSYNVRSDI